MSEGYASRLSDYEAKGVCGLPEVADKSSRSLNLKLKKLYEMVKESKHFVVLTGAGISTSAGIPDFRGPKGVWTLEEKNKKQKKRKTALAPSNSSEMADTANVDATKAKQQEEPGVQVKQARVDGDTNKKKRPLEEQKEEGINNNNNKLADFSEAQPTYTHCALSRLSLDGILKYCITQNVDGLHRRSGMKRSKHSVLHGCAFTEVCEDCDLHYFRDFDVKGMSFQKTGRKCDHSEEGCQTGDLRDTLLDWEDELPEYDYSKALEECEASDLVLCLGTSLRMKPADELPTMAKKFVIVNLQQTPYDDGAALVIRAKVDDVMKDLMNRLGYEEDWIDTHYQEATVEKVWQRPSMD